MIHAIEFVTVTVDDLPSSLRLLAEQCGLRVVSDARASVGHLSAWRHPVHESVRLVELASDGQPVGRVRLACVEDGASGPPRQDESVLRSGPKLLDFRAGFGSEAPLLTAGPGGLPLLRDSGAPGLRLRSIWIVTRDPAVAGRFYGDVLGFTVTADPWLSSEKGTALVRTALRLPGRAAVETVSYRGAGQSEPGIVLVHVPELTEAQPLHSVGLQPGGISLLTCACVDLDELAARLPALGIEPPSPPQHIGLPGGVPGRVMMVRGPNQELFEFIETAP